MEKLQTSHECMGVNGEALQLHVVYRTFLLQVTRESVSVLQVTRESISRTASRTVSEHAMKSKVCIP